MPIAARAPMVTWPASAVDASGSYAVPGGRGDPGGESEEVRARAELYYRASLDTIDILERGKTVR